MLEFSSSVESEKDAPRAASIVRVALQRTRTLVAFIAIFGAALSGYGALGLWTIAVSAVALISLSYAEFGGLYRRADQLGMGGLSFAVAMQSFANALMASGGAYASGLIFRLF